MLLDEGTDGPSQIVTSNTGDIRGMLETPWRCSNLSRKLRLKKTSIITRIPESSKQLIAQHAVAAAGALLKDPPTSPVTFLPKPFPVHLINTSSVLPSLSFRKSSQTPGSKPWLTQVTFSSNFTSSSYRHLPKVRVPELQVGLPMTSPSHDVPQTPPVSPLVAPGESPGQKAAFYYHSLARALQNVVHERLGLCGKSSQVIDRL
jgi:hypothetical protein